MSSGPSIAVKHRLLGRSLAHHQVAVDAGVRLRRAAVELDEPLDRAVEVVGVEAVERLDRYRRRGEHLARELHEDAAVARLGQRIGDREVGDRRREQHRAVGLLRPEEADDVRGLLRVRQVAQQLLEPLAAAAVELADVERAAAADEDPARLEVVGAEVHERADRALRADAAGDLRLVDPVLQRDDEAVGREPRRDRRERGVRVLRLDREQHRLQPVGQLVRATRPAPSTVNVSTGPSIASPFALIAATWSASASQKSTEWPSRASRAPTVPPIAPAPTTT